MTHVRSSWTPPPAKNAPTPAELIRDAVEIAKAFGAAKGWGRCVSDKYVEGVGVVLVFENGSRTSVPMPAGSKT